MKKHIIVDCTINTIILFFSIIGLSITTYSVVEFDQIKNRTVVQFELTDIIVDLTAQNKVYLLDRWREISPLSFRKLNFTYAYLDAGNRILRQGQTNQAISLYIKSYQVIDKDISNKIEATYKASFYLYAQKKRSEALFYIDRAIELMVKSKMNHKLSEDIFYLKRRIVWRYLSRLELLPDNAISTVEFDGDDVWIGMWSGAVARFSRSLSQLDIFNTRNSKLPSPYVRDILVEKDKVWVATHCGLAYYNKVKSTWHNISSLNKYKLKSIIRDDKYYYISTLFKGVLRSQDGLKWQNIVSGKSVLDMIKVEDELYLATPDNGVLVYNNGTTEKFLTNISAKTIIQDVNSDFLWIGTYGNGLLKINRKNSKIVDWFLKEDLRSDYVESLLIIDNQLWVGTLESGVSIYNFKTKEWSYLGLYDGIPGLDITTITKENDHIWFGTLAGGIGIYLSPSMK